MLFRTVPALFVTHPVSQTNHTAGSLSFSCVVVGLPVPDIIWFKDDQELLESENVTITYSMVSDNISGEATSVLRVTNLTLPDVGSYLCVANNTGAPGISFTVTSEVAVLTVHCEFIKLRTFAEIVITYMHMYTAEVRNKMFNNLFKRIGSAIVSTIKLAPCFEILCTFETGLDWKKLQTSIFNLLLKVFVGYMDCYIVLIHYKIRLKLSTNEIHISNPPFVYTQSDFLYVAI